MNLFTLHGEHAVLLGLFTILTLINGRLHDGASGSYWFSAYSGAAFLGALLVALRGYGVPDSISIVLGIGAFHISYLCLHGALRAFFERSGGPGWGVAAQSAVVVAGTSGLIEYGVLQPDAGRRVVF